jgi:DNA-binding transcriptional regulator YdaS (Cro superfamily)
MQLTAADLIRAYQNAVNVAGGQQKLADLLGLSQASISRWSFVPEGRLHQVSAATGIPEAELRPDLFSNGKRAASSLNVPVNSATRALGVDVRDEALALRKTGKDSATKRTNTSKTLQIAAPLPPTSLRDRLTREVAEIEEQIERLSNEQGRLEGERQVLVQAIASLPH